MLLFNRKIPTGGLVDPVNEPEFVVSAHSEKVQIVKFHPLAKDILLTAAFDRSVKIWNLNDAETPKISLLVSPFNNIKAGNSHSFIKVRGSIAVPSTSCKIQIDEVYSLLC